MKRYRERLKTDPVKREEYLEKERDRWKHQRKTSKENLIRELSDREKRRKIKMRREEQRRFRSRRRQRQKSADGDTLAPISDPSVSSTLSQITPTPIVQPASSARARGRSRVRKSQVQSIQKNRFFRNTTTGNKAAIRKVQEALPEIA